MKTSAAGYQDQYQRVCYNQYEKVQQKSFIDASDNTITFIEYEVLDDAGVWLDYAEFETSTV